MRFPLEFDQIVLVLRARAAAARAPQAIIDPMNTLADGEYVLVACEHYEVSRVSERDLATVLAAFPFAQKNLPALQRFQHFHYVPVI